MPRNNRLSALLAICLAAGLLAASPAHSQTRLPPGAAKHVVVYQEAGRFGGMPANNGIWVWGNEILVGFKQAWFKAHPTSHSIDRQKPEPVVLARSLDGGESWKVEDPDNFVNDGGKPVPSPAGIDFSHPNVAVRVRYDHFFVSYDRGKTWKGPYQFTGLKHEVTSRTDYIVNGPRDAFFFFSARQPHVKAGSYQDRAFTARTTDGGKTFEFVSWMTHEPYTTRSVMSSTVRVLKTELVSALRRRDDSSGAQRNWIDIYASTDNGGTWAHRSKVADTDRTEMAHNGNPPSMVRLRDGRLVVTYGYRSTPYGMRAKISKDNGKTWGDEIVLRNDARNWDFGYSRTVQRPDGKVATIYYYATEKDPEQHIAATIWDPDALERKR